jgi:hypothetical protein
MSNVARFGALFVVLSVAVAAQDGGVSSPAAGPIEPSWKTFVTSADVQPLWDVLRPLLPARLVEMRGNAAASEWLAWIRGHDADIRTRVVRGEEETLVNFWLFGTSFTAHPPARPRDVERRGGGATLAAIADLRLDDLLVALASPGSNERLQWAGELLRSRGLDPGAPGARARARAFLSDIGARMVAENASYDRALDAARATSDHVAWIAANASLYRDRGLSSDTSILSSFAIDATLEALAAAGTIGAEPIRRVAIVGPGLDVFNKADGHDFYPVQTIQPFAVIDSLVRLGLSRAGAVSVTTFDVSASVNAHLTSSVARALRGESYLLHLPLGEAEPWSAPLVAYWEQAGARIGEPVDPARAPRAAGGVRVRAVRVRPDVVAAIVPRDLNLVAERLEPLDDDARFDLVIATNVFVYYEPFEQVLAMANLARMLRSGGTLLSNHAVLPVAPMRPAFDQHTIAFSERQSDYVFRYQRQ